MARRADEIAWGIAAKQHGVLTRAQAIDHEITEREVDRRLAAGTWQVMHSGVYRLVGTEASWAQQLTGAALWVTRGYAFSHRCAAALWGFNRFKKEVVELTTTRCLRSDDYARVHVVRDLLATDITIVRQFRATTLTRTLIDLAESEDFADVRACVHQALSTRRLTLEALERGLQGRRSGAPALRALVREIRGGAGICESELEERVLELFEAAGLPHPEKQKEIKAGNRVCRVDFLVPGTRLIIEADGYAYHSDNDPFEDDRTRDISLSAKGYVVHRWTWEAITRRPRFLIEAARRIIAQGPRRQDLAAARPHAR